MTIRLIIILLLFAGRSFAAPQQDSTATAIHHDVFSELHQPGRNNGQVVIHCDPKINNLLKLHIRQNQKHQAYPGYRIQIYSISSMNADINQLKQMRDNFEQAFPDMPAYLKYFDPDFKIRAGNFHSRLECIPALYRIRKMYPSSYPVKTDITLEELKRKPMQDIPVTEKTTPE